MEIDTHRLMALLENAVNQADEWCDECCGSYITNDPMIMEAREIIKQYRLECAFNQYD